MSIPKSGPLQPFVDFTTSKDNNRDEEAAIQPCANNEPITATLVTDCMRRPADNIRARTEVARGAVDDLLYLENANQGMMLFDPGTATITWNGTVASGGDGKFTISSNLYQMPFTTVGNDANTPPVGGKFGSLTVLRADDVAIITITSVIPSWSGGDRINITVKGGAALACQLLGGFDIVLTIVDGATTRLQAITALNATIGSVGTATALAGADGDVIKTAQAKKYVTGNWDSEAHVITAANLVSFFNVAGNPLKEGDSLCVQYSNLIENAGTGGRRQSTPENTNTTIPAGSFFNSRVNPERLFGSLPLCKVINNRLWFIGGTVVKVGTPVGLGGSVAANVAYAGGPAWLDGTTNPATNVEAQLDKIVTDLIKQDSATVSGADKIGAEADGKTLTRGSVASQLRQLSADKIGGFVYPGLKIESYINEQIVISPFDAVINGVHRTLGSPVTLSNVTTGLTKGSWYYLYAYWTGASIDYEYSLTPPVANLKTKTGDTSRTYLCSFRPSTTNGRLPYFNKFDRFVYRSFSGNALDEEDRRWSRLAPAAGSGSTTTHACDLLVPPHVVSVEVFVQITAANAGDATVAFYPGAAPPSTFWTSAGYSGATTLAAAGSYSYHAGWGVLGTSSGRNQEIYALATVGITQFITLTGHRD